MCTRLTQFSYSGTKPSVILVNFDLNEFIIGISLLINVVSIIFIGVIFAAVPVRNTSSDINNSVLSTGLSITFIPSLFASSITLARVMP